MNGPHKMCACMRCGERSYRRRLVDGGFGPCSKCGGRMVVSNSVERRRFERAKAEVEEKYGEAR